jgi:DNA helicase HerA-like ATPase
VTLQTIAEQFSAAGVPVFLADVKGDLAGIAMPGSHDFKHAATLEARGEGDWRDRLCLSRQSGGVLGSLWRTGPPDPHHDLGNGAAAAGAAAGAERDAGRGAQHRFPLADDNGLLLIDFEDLQQVLIACAEQASQLATRYGNISKASVGTIQRQLLAFESQGAAQFFGEPALRDQRFHPLRRERQGLWSTSSPPTS